jgi:8-oxo-dGTP pyrophosphatase MutT (NUDIX family)
MTKELPIKIQTILYRMKDGAPLVLVIKRSPNDGGFWQTITGTLEIDESILESRQRELQEEVGISDARYDEEEIARFAWTKNNWTVVELVYSAETKTEAVKLNSEEHTEHKWLPVDDAIELVEKSDTKDCLKKFKETFRYIFSST